MKYLIQLALGVWIMTSGFLWATASVAGAQLGTQQESDAKNLVADMLRRIRDAREVEFTAKIAVTRVVGGNETTTAQFRLRQPNQFYVRAISEKVQTHYISDGTTLTIYRPSIQQYVQTPARDSMLSTMYAATSLTSLSGRLLNFFWVADVNRDARFSALKQQSVDGQACQGIRIERFEDRFDVWISEVQRLPCKLIARRTDGGSTETQTVTFVWKMNPDFSADAFRFTPPPGGRPFASK